MKPKERNINLDALRVFACLMIVLIHSEMPTTKANSLFLSCVSFFCVCGIGLFFMISGNLLLPVTIPTRAFIRRRLTKLIGPTLIWTLIFMAYNWAYDGNVPRIQAIISMPLTAQGNGVLWYMYTIIGLYLLAPILSPWLEKVQWHDAKIYLIIIVLAFCLPILQIWTKINNTQTGLLYYFSGFIGYFVMGWALKRFGNRLPGLRWIGLGFILSIMAAVICKLCHYNINFYSLFWFYSLPTLIQSMFWFKLFCEKIKFDLFARCRGIISLLSNLSLGIYLIHIIVIRRYLWHIQWINGIDSYPLQSVTIALLGFVISAAIVWLVSLLPFSKFIIGYTCTRSNK